VVKAQNFTKNDDCNWYSTMSTVQQIIILMNQYLHTLVLWFAHGGFLGLLLGAWLLLSLGCPVLILMTIAVSLAGNWGLLVAVLAVHLALPTIYLLTPKLPWMNRLNSPILTNIAQMNSDWLYMGAATIPFWLFIALCSLSGRSLRETWSAILLISTPNIIIFGLATLAGSKIAIPSWITAFAAALLIILGGRIATWWRRL
jgi:hypothetical protein